MSRSDKDDSLPSLDLHQQGSPSFASLLAHVRAPLGFTFLIVDESLFDLPSLWCENHTLTIPSSRRPHKPGGTLQSRCSSWEKPLKCQNYSQFRYFCDDNIENEPNTATIKWWQCLNVNTKVIFVSKKCYGVKILFVAKVKMKSVKKKTENISVSNQSGK